MKIEISANVRALKGTGASRRLRHSGKTPGILYGGKNEAKTIELDSKELSMQFKHEAFHASILALNLDGKSESVLLRDYQLHPVRNNILHIDFQRVNENEKIHVKVSFHFINEDTAPGIKLGGGLVSHVLTETEISCLPKDLPQYLEVDLGALEVGDSIHLSALKLPEGVELTALTHGNDATITTISKPKVAQEEDSADIAPAAEESSGDKAEEPKE